MPDNEVNPGIPLVQPLSLEDVNNIPSSPDDIRGVDFETVERALTTPPSDILPLDENFKKMIDEATLDINKYAIDNTVNVRSPYPGLATTTYDPLKQSSPPDLNTVEGRARAIQSIGNTVAGEFNPAAAYVDPIEVGIRQSNFERYYRHPKFDELGWHPYANNEEYYNQNSTIWDDVSRMRKQWLGLYGTGFTSVYRSLGDLFDSEYSYMDPDLPSAEEFEHAMRIGNSNREGGVFSMKFANNLALNSAYTFGILGSIAVEEAVMLGITAASTVTGPGAVAPAVATASRTAYNAGRAGRAIGQFFDVFKYGNATRNLVKTLSKSDNARDFYRSIKAGGKFIGDIIAPETLYALKNLKTSRNALNNMSNMAKANRTFGGFYRDLRAVNLAMAESKMEAGMVYNDTVYDLHSEYLNDNNGNSPDIDRVRAFHNTANKAAFKTAQWNFPTIYISNRIVLDGALRGFKPMGRVVDDALNSVGGRALRNRKLKVGSQYTDPGTGFKRLRNIGIKGGARALGAAALRYTSANFAEGFQEIAQEAIAVGTKDYYVGLFNDPSMGGLEAQMASISAGIESQMGQQGWEVFMSGFLMGGIVQGPQKLFFEGLPKLYTKIKDPDAYAMQKQRKDDYFAALNTTLNKMHKDFVEDPGSYFDPVRLNAMAVKQMSETMVQTSFDSDVRGFMDSKNVMIFHHLNTMYETGKLNDFIDEIKSFQEMTDDELLGAFPSQKADVKSGKLRERFDKMILNGKEMRKNHEDWDDEHVSPYDPYKFEKGSREYDVEAVKDIAFRHAKTMMLFTKDTFEKALTRYNKIYKSLSEDPILSKIDAKDIAVLTNVKSLKTEIETLTDELSQEPTTDELKKIHKVKIERLRLLNDFLDVLTNPINWTKNERGRIIYDADTKLTEEGIEISNAEWIGVFNGNKISTLRKPFVAFLKHLANTQDDFLDTKRINKVLRNIVDYKHLKGRAQDYYKAIEVLLEPGRMDELAERMAATILKIWDNRRAEVEKRIKKYIGTIEKNEFLNQLALIGVYPTPEDVEVFLRDPDGPIPTSYMDKGGEINQFSDSKKWGKIQDIIKAYRSQLLDETTEEQPKTIDPVTGEVVLDIDDVVGRAEMPGTGIEEGTQTVLNNTYEKAKKKDDFNLQPGEWLQSELAQNIIKTRARLKDLYNQKKDGDDEDIPEFEAWIMEQADDPVVYDIIDEHGLTPNDITIEGSAKDEVNPDRFKTDVKGEHKEEILAQLGGIVLKKTTAPDPDNPDAPSTTFYTIVDNDNKNVYRRYAQFLGTKEYYETFDEADKAYKLIINQLPKNEPFPFDGQTFKQNDLIEDADGKVYIVISTPTGIKKWGGTLAAIPLENRNKRDKDGNPAKFKAKGGVKLAVGQWAAEKWSFHHADMSKQVAQNVDQVKLRITEPVQFIAHEKGRETKGEGVVLKEKRFAHVLRNLTPDQLLQLEIIITPGPKWSELQKKSPAERDPYTWGEAEGYKKNQQIRGGAHKYTIEIKFPDADWVDAKMEEQEKYEVSKSETIGYLQGPFAATLLDKAGNPINLLNITQEQVGQIFDITDYTLKNAHNSVVRNYANAIAIQEIAAEKLKEQGGERAVLTVADFNGLINFKTTPGRPLYTKKAATKYNELEYQYLDGEKIIWIVDLQKTWLPTGRELSEIMITNLKNIYPGDPTKAAEALAEHQPTVKTEMKRQVKWLKNAGRYVGLVKMPNGVYTFIPLKGELFSTKELDEIATDTIAKQNETIEKNLEDPEASDRKAKDAQFTHAFNTAQEEKYYITGKPGHIITLKVQKTGDIRIELLDRTIWVGKSPNKKPKSTTITLSKKFITDQVETGVVPDVDTMANFVNVLNAGIAVYNSKAKKGDKVDLEISPTGFRKSIPKNTNVEDLIKKAETDIENPIRDRIKLMTTVADPVLLDTIINTAVTSGETSKTEEVEEEVEEVSEEEEVTDVEQLLEENFSKVTEQQRMTVAQKLVNNEVLTELEDLIYDSKWKEDINLKIQELNAPAQPGAVEESDNENKAIIEQWKKAVDEVKAIKAQIKKDIKAKAKEENWTDQQVGDAMLEALSTDKPQVLIDKENEAKDLEGRARGTAFKIIEKFDGNDIEDINEFISWAKQNLPDFFSMRDIEELGQRLANNGITVGAFVLKLKNVAGGVKVGGTIYTGAKSPYRYHEAFHGVFRMLLTDVEIERYLTIARKESRAKLRKEFKDKESEWYGKSFNDVLQKLRNSSPLYARMTKKELERAYYEEYLADEFEKFKRNPKSTQTSSENKSLFTRIIEWIATVFRFYSKNELTQLFQNIDSGKFKTTRIKENVFVSEALKGTMGAPAQIALKNIPLKTILVPRKNVVTGEEKLVPTTVYFPSEKTKSIASTISAIYLSREMALNFRKDVYNPKEMLDKAINDWINMRNPDRAFYKDWRNGSGIPYEDIVDDLILEYDALLEHRSAIKEVVLEYLELFNVQGEEEMYNEEIFEDKSLSRTEEWDKDPSQIGGVTALPRALKLFIATTTLAEQDEFGNMYLSSEKESEAGVVWDEDTKEFVVDYNQEPIVVAVDFLEAYTGILKAVQGVKDPMEILRRMYYFGVGNPQSKAVIDKIFTQLGLQESDILGDHLPIVADPGFFMAVINGFTQFRIDQLFVQTDPKSQITRIFAANNRDDSVTQTDRWAQTYASRFKKIRKAAKKKGVDENETDEEIRKREDDARAERREEIEVKLNAFAEQLIDEDSKKTVSAITDSALEKYSVTVAEDLYEYLGIKLSPTYIAYSIAAGIVGKLTPKQEVMLATFYGDVTPIQKDDIIQIKNAVHRGDNLFIEKGEGVKTRLRNLAKGNGFLDETVGSTVFRDPEGNLIYAHQQPTFHLEEIAALNSKQYREDKKGDIFLNKEFLLNDDRFNALADEGMLRVVRINGSRRAIMKVDEEEDVETESSLSIKKNPGIVFGKAEGKEFILNLINSYTAFWNDRKERAETIEYLDENGERRSFTTAPVFLRVLSESNTGDMAPLPVYHTVDKDEDGSIILTDESKERISGKVENEFNRIVRRALDGDQGIRDEGRGLTLHNTGNLVTKRKLAEKDRRIIKEPTMPPQVKKRIFEGKQKIFLRKGGAASTIGLIVGEESVVSLTLDGKEKRFLFKYRGSSHITELDASTIKQELGGAISDDRGGEHKWPFFIGKRKYHAEKKDQQQFFKGFMSQNIYEWIPLEETNLEVGLVEVEAASEVKGENITSKGSAFAKELTNPGNTLKVEYKGKTFRNSEHAYQTWKSGEFDQKAFESTAFKPVGSKPADRGTSYQTMVDILIAKLEQHPELIKGIAERGGMAWLTKSTHEGFGDAFWEGSDGGFMRALKEAYKKTAPVEEAESMADVPLEAFGKEDLLEDYSQTTGEVIGGELVAPKTQGGFENKGKGTPEGDGKDKAMREVAEGFIGELGVERNKTGHDLRRTKGISSSTGTSFKTIGTKFKEYSKDFVTFGEDAATVQSGKLAVADDMAKIVMLARNSEFKNKALHDNTKEAILEAYNSGASFVVGDMPGVDTQFVEYLLEIGADFTVYHTGKTPRKGAIPAPTESITEIEGLNERLDNYGFTRLIIPENYYEGERPKGRLNSFKDTVAKVGSNLQVLADVDLSEFKFLSKSDLKRLENLKKVVKAFRVLNMEISSSDTRTNIKEQEYAKLSGEILNEFVDIINPHVKTQLGKSISTTSQSTISEAPVSTAAPVTPTVPEEKVLYSAFLVDDVEKLKKTYKPKHVNEFYHHSTIEFKPENVDDIVVGLKHKIKVLGRVTTDKVDVLIIDSPRSKKDNPHITLSTVEGVNPAESDAAITEAIDSGKYKPYKTSRYIEVTEGYVTNKGAITAPDVDIAVFEKDTALKERLEKLAQTTYIDSEGIERSYTFNKALEEIGITRDELDDIIEERMMLEFKEFLISIVAMQAKQAMSISIQNGLTNKDKTITEATRDAMSLYNLRYEDPDFNLAQIFFNDWLNTKSINDIMLGDQAMTLKNAVDQIKRAKMQNAAGPNASSPIIAPYIYDKAGNKIGGLGIDHPVKHISLFGIDDPTFIKKYTVGGKQSYKEGGKEKTETGDKADAQVWYTTKGFRYFWFGLGKLTKAQDELLSMVERGEEVSLEEWEGNIKKGTEGFKQLKAAMNSQKLVYGDGKVFLKFSASLLSKELTSELNNRGEWVALPHRKDLHNLRVKMEKWEDQARAEGRPDTVAITAPVSAIKMLKANIAPAEAAFDGSDIVPENIMDLDAEYMRLQQINPSNKMVATDPTQIKSLITSEQRDDVTVQVGDVELTVGELRELYHKSVSDRLTIKYLAKRDLIFDLGTAQDEIQKSIKLGRVTANLRSFLLFAQVALKSAQTRSQMIEFFELDESGEQKYNLNAPMMIQKFQELFLAYFSKKVLRESVPGHVAALVSDKGMKIIKKVISIDEETGQPERWEVIRTDIWKSYTSKPKLVKEEFDNPKERTFVKGSLKKGDYYVDDLRANVKKFNEAGEWTKEVYSEMMIAPHHKEVLERILVSAKFKSKQAIEDEFYVYVNTLNYSPDAGKAIIRTEIEDYDPVKAKFQFANAKGYVYDEFDDEFESVGNENPNAIPEALAKIFGTRIPGQDKHSAVNLMVVDYLPVFYGSSAVFPEDLIEISGADFDIDKLYMHIKEFYNIGDTFYEYGKGKTENQKYADYIRYTIHQSWQKDSSISEAIDLWTSRDDGGGGVEDQTGVIDQYLTKEEIENLIGPAPIESDSVGYKTEYNTAYNALFMKALLKFAEEKDEVIMELWGKQVKKENRGRLMGAMEILNLPITKKQYLAWKEKRKYKIGGKEYLPEPYTAAINNDNLDYKYALLGNRGMVEPRDGREKISKGVAFEPAVTDPLIEVVNELEAEFPELMRSVDESWLDVDNLLGKMRSWINVKTGARSIGAAVLPNIIVNILSENNIKIRSKIEDGKETIPQIQFNGHTYRDFNVEYEIDPQTGKVDPTTHRTQYIISALVTAMTDNAKERLAARLGLNKDALAVVVSLVSLGVSFRTSVYLVQHPTIKDLYYRAINKNQPTDPGIYRLVSERMGDIYKSLKEDFREDVEDYDHELQVTDKLLKQALKKGSDASYSEEGVKRGTYTVDDANAELAILEQFRTVHGLKEHIRKITPLVELHNGFGQDTIAIEKREESVADLGLDLNDKNFDELLDAHENPVPIDVRKVFHGNNYQAAYYRIDKEFTRELLPAVFMTRAPEFVKIKDILLKNLDPDSRALDAERRNRIEKDLVSYLAIKSYMHTIKYSPLKASLQNGMIYDQESEGQLTIEEVVNYINNYLDNAGPIDDKGKPTRKANYLMDHWLQLHTTKDLENKTHVNQANSATWSKLTDSQVVDLQNSFTELHGDPILNPYAFHLVHYLLVKDGMQYRQGTIMDAIPPHMFDQFLQSVEQAHNVLLFQTKTKEVFKGTFGATLPELYNEFVEGYLLSAVNRDILTYVSKPPIVDTGGTEQIKIKTTQYNRTTVEKDSANVYVFGDARTGTGNAGHLNQQSIRGLSNAFRIRLKKSMDMHGIAADFFDEETLEMHMKEVDADINAIVQSGADRKIIFPNHLLDPKDIAQMKLLSEKFYEHVKQSLDRAFGYNIDGITEKTLEESKKRLGGPLYLHEGEKTVVVSSLAGVPVEDTPRGRKVKKIVRKKGWFKLAKKHTKTVTDNLKLLYGNKYERYFRERRKIVSEGQTIMEVGFPLVIRVNMTSEVLMGKGGRAKYRYFKLQVLHTSRTAPMELETGGLVNMIMQGEEMAYGLKAEYVEVDLEGAATQTAIGFVTGSRPPLKVLIEATKGREIDLNSEQETQKEPEYLRKMKEGAEPQASEDAVVPQGNIPDFEGFIQGTPDMGKAYQEGTQNKTDEANKVEYKGDNVEVDGKNIADVKKEAIEEVNKKVEGEAEEKAAPIEEQSDVDDTEIANVVPPGEGVGVTNANTFKERLNMKGEDAPTKYEKIEEFWNELTPGQKLKLAQTKGDGEGIRSKQKLLDLFNLPDNRFTEKEFVDWLKTCII